MDAGVFSRGVLLFQKGDRLNKSPEYTAGASADYAFPIGGNGFRGQVSASANYTSKMTVRTLSGTNVLMGVGERMVIGRASFSIESPKYWRTSLYVDNVTDERDPPLRTTNAFRDWDDRIRPRTIGLQLEYRFD